MQKNCLKIPKSFIFGKWRTKRLISKDYLECNIKVLHNQLIYQLKRINDIKINNFPLVIHWKNIHFHNSF